MLFNLALKNIKKSLKDYSIYFFTLVVAVAIFYTFNSLDAQEAMFRMNESHYDIVKSIIQIMSYLSIFISVILGFLIVYSNNFLIKRRKKEFGLYLTLGMSKRKVSTILIIETLLVGIISLIIGLVLGIFLSQLLALFTINLFEINMSSFAFVFSSAAVIKTLIYFTIIFILVMIFNIISLSKNKLINLLTADKKNEQIKTRNPLVIIITFVIAIGLLVYAYKLLFDGAMFAFDNQIVKMLIAGALGTFFLFFSVSGFFLKIIQKNKKVYYRNLNMFVLKQVDSKANSTVISTTIISLMLLLTIGILSGAISLMSVFNSDISDNNKTDVTITKYVMEYVGNEYGEFTAQENKYHVNDLVKQDFFKDYIKEYVTYNMFSDENLIMANLIDQKTQEALIKEYGKEISFDSSIDIMAESDYNKILDLYGLSKQKIDLKEDEYLLTSNVPKAVEFYTKAYASGNKLTLNNKELKPKTSKIVEIAYQNYSGSSNFNTIIVDDDNIKNLTSHNNTLIGNYVDTKDVEKLEKEFLDKCGYFGASSFATKLSVKNSNIGMKAIMTFVGLYLGIIFAISSATVLAIGQLSESNDNKKRYLVLKQIGTPEKMISKSLLVQIAVAFLTPLIVALFHAFFGLRELNGMIELLGDIDLTKSIFLTAGFIIIVYGGYFVATYLCSRNIIKE